jgi:uncharacterized protein (DUF2336 family)
VLDSSPKKQTASGAEIVDMLNQTVVLIGELEGALKNGSPDKRLTTLRRLTDLFLHDADRLNEQQIQIFDDVLMHLIHRIQGKALIQLSTLLAPVDNAPIEVIRRLAHDEEIEVAGPVLVRSTRLSDEDLISIGETRSQQHLLAISGRALLMEMVTDVLVRRGDRDVVHTLAGNPGACFSEQGYATLVKNAESDEGLFVKLGRRIDIPLELLRQLLRRATNAVRAHLLASAPPEALEKIRGAIASIAQEIDQEAADPRDFERSNRVVYDINRSGKLSEATVAEFAARYRYEEVVSAVALLASAPVHLIEVLMRNLRPDGLVVACKAAGLKWPTISVVLKNRFTHHTVSQEDLDAARRAFLALSQPTAQRTLRFWQTQESVRQAS